MAIRIEGAREHNLKGVSVTFPHRQLTVVTGVSGSGKSSLVFDTLHATGQRRYLETLSGRARLFVERLPSPRVESIEGLSPTIALAQRTGTSNPRSTVGTLSGLWDLLRVLFARCGVRADGAVVEDRGPWLFSFNTPRGACPACGGLGVEDRVDPELLVADGSKTLRQGALVPTTPTGYIVYSQVTVDVLDQVCRAHGFDIDTPWRELTDAQRDVVFHGSDRIEVPFGKHPLESRMRWSGITARPRELGHYRGLIPTIAETLQRHRNANALRFARSQPCSSCDGTRLNEAARALQIDGSSIAEVGALPLEQLGDWIGGVSAPSDLRRVIDALCRRVRSMTALGLRHLSCDRAAVSLSGGEAQRVRLAASATAGLAGVTFVLDEPSTGLHPSEERAVLDTLRGLCDDGNTVVVVEHSDAALRAADHVVDVGPGAGVHGGRVLFEGPPEDLESAPVESATRLWHGADAPAMPHWPAPSGGGSLTVRGARAHNLAGDDVVFRLGALNVVCGVAGAGKSSLVDTVLSRALRRALHRATDVPGHHQGIDGADALRKVVHVDQAPIGRTPRSNPATYTGLFDEVRGLFANLSEAREAGMGRGHFSLNVKGGRCETCQGSGREVVGMHGLPDVELTCSDCAGRRFGAAVLGVRWHGHSVLDILDATVETAREWFADQPKIARVLEVLHDLGLDYLPLGQPATTLSGGEAQRVKLATELARPAGGHTLYILDEPTVGLHRADVALLLRALGGLVEKGHTVVVVEHDLDVVRAAGHVVELGPGTGADGGHVVFAGPPEDLADAMTLTGRALAMPAPAGSPRRAPEARSVRPVQLRGVRTNCLRDLDVEFPARGLTVVTGVSGSGKSSLVFDTLHAESRARFTESLSAHARRQLGGAGARGELAEAIALRPTVALGQRWGGGSRRSTVATLSEVHPLLRLLWSRAGVEDDGERTRRPAGTFSFHRREGACPACEGLGAVMRCDPTRLVTDPEAPLFAGAIDGTKTGRAYGDPHGKHRAIVDAVAETLGFDFSVPWSELGEPAQHAAMEGCGDREFDVVWRFRRGRRAGEHRFETTWPGLCAEVEDEYSRKRGDARGLVVEQVMTARCCELCGGDRLVSASRTVRFAGLRLGELCARTVQEVLAWTCDRAAPDGLDERTAAIFAEVRPELGDRLSRLVTLGLGHLALDRAADTLSGGEAQRVRLARQLATPLHGVIYVLDEPTVGLHPRDTEGLIDVLGELVARGNGVVCVEHDLDIVRAADHVVELGPGAGARGGTIVAAAAPDRLAADCRTARALRRSRGVITRTPRTAGPPLTIHGAHLHHLSHLDVAIPTASLVAVTGVSGSGKTSLVFGVLAATARTGRPVGCASVAKLDRFRAVVDVAPALRAGSPQSCVATAAGVFDELRKRFAATEAARERDLKPSAFAFASKGGRCETCKGLGRTRSDLDFLGDVWTACEDCGGRRYRSEVLAVTCRNMDMAELLDADVDEVLTTFGDVRKVAEPLRVLSELGLGYLKLGQGSDTLSSGEAQRLFLATELARGGDGPTLFLLDEPTRGLHPDDVDALLDVLEGLVDAEHTVVVVEHDVEVIARADHVVDLGPGAGTDGGALMFAGPPAELVGRAGSVTGGFVRRA